MCQIKLRLIHIITIDQAKVVKSPSGATFIEFSGESTDGQLIQYLSVCINKKDCSANTHGVDMIQAIMGCTEVKSISEKMISASQTIVPEFSGKRVGLLLQKILRTKQDGGDTYSFEIRIPFHPEYEADHQGASRKLGCQDYRYYAFYAQG